jgi:KDO2-lipid IV(A) lauroyltransferase
VLVSGHIGPWERALQWLAGELGGVEALAARHRLAAVDRFFVERRARGGVRTLCSSRPVMSALQSLKSGGWIAALADRPRRGATREAARRSSGAGPVGPSNPRGIVAIDRGPLLLARRAGALVIPGVSTFAADGALEIDFDAPFSLDPTAGGLEVPEGLARLQRFFDSHVRAHPTQWFEWGDLGPCPRGGRARHPPRGQRRQGSRPPDRIRRGLAARGRARPDARRGWPARPRLRGGAPPEARRVGYRDRLA